TVPPACRPPAWRDSRPEIRLPAGHGPHDQQRLGPCRDGVGQWGIRRCVRQILLTGEKPHERSAPLPAVVADRTTQHWIAGFEGTEARARRRGPLDAQLPLAVDACKRPKMCRQYNANHGSVWPSTDNTGGRSRTMGAQLPPASADPYPCPPVVPKYTP